VNSSSLGISLIKDLADQIDAKFSYNNKNGTQFSIQLK
jgi:two-component sensor histidine kinase